MARALNKGIDLSQSSHLHQALEDNDPTPNGQVSVRTVEKNGFAFTVYDNNVAPDIDPRVFGMIKLPVPCDFCGDTITFAKDGQGSLIHYLDGDHGSIGALTHYDRRNVLQVIGQVIQAYTREGIEPPK